MELDKYLEQSNTSQQFTKELASREIKKVEDIEELRRLTLYLWNELLESQDMNKRLMLRNIQHEFKQDIINMVETPRINTYNELDKRTE